MLQSIMATRGNNIFGLDLAMFPKMHTMRTQDGIHDTTR